MAEPLRIKVKTFATLREAFGGRGILYLDLPEGSTIQDLLNLLESGYSSRISSSRLIGENPNVKITQYTCPFNCGLCPGHMSHTALANIVVTNRCDLYCWYCFFFAERAGYVYEPTIDQIREMARTLKKMRPVPGNSVQLTGGEPALRDDLPEILSLIHI